MIAMWQAGQIKPVSGLWPPGGLRMECIHTATQQNVTVSFIAS